MYYLNLLQKYSETFQFYEYQNVISNFHYEQTDFF